MIRLVRLSTGSERRVVALAGTLIFSTRDGEE